MLELKGTVEAIYFNLLVLQMGKSRSRPKIKCLAQSLLKEFLAEGEPQILTN